MKLLKVTSAKAFRKIRNNAMQSAGLRTGNSRLGNKSGLCFCHLLPANSAGTDCVTAGEVQNASGLRFKKIQNAYVMLSCHGNTVGSKYLTFISS
jgi:hypothetical protein